MSLVASRKFLTTGAIGLATSAVGPAVNLLAKVAREDTILVPAFREIVSADKFDSLGEHFEKKEDELSGNDGF